MTAQVLHSPSHFSSSSSSSLSCAANDNAHQNQTLFNSNPVEESETQDVGSSIKKEEEDQLSLLAVFFTVFRKSLVGCRSLGREEFCSMEIGWPTNVQHVAHVTFDRFNGFLGLPVEFEPEVPRRAPSASANVFGVSTESMQCSYDSRGNSVPTILLLMQRHLYAQGGLQAEGIFRINADNSQEEYVRDQLNRGLVPDGIDVHCLAGLIKAWFRELPAGILDSLTPEQVMECQSEEECAQLARLLPPTESALLDWAVNLMADVVQEEHHNKMNAHNIAMVFAPNMTQMADPLTALMYAVQVMNFLKTLVVKALGEREDCVTDNSESATLSDPSDENGHHSPSFNCLGHPKNEEVDLLDPIFLAHEPVLDCEIEFTEEYYSTADLNEDFTYSSAKATPDNFPAELFSKQPDSTAAIDSPRNWIQENGCINYTGQSSNSNLHKGTRKDGQNFVPVAIPVEKSKGISIVSRINSRIERVETWR